MTTLAQSLRATKLSSLQFKAIVLGLLAGLAAGIVWAFVVAAYLGPSLAGSPNPVAALGPNMPILVSLSLIGSFVTSFVCGLVAATVAKGAELANALAIGLAVVLVSAALFFPSGLNDYPLWYNVPAFLFTVPLAVVGGCVVLRRRA